MSHQLSHYFESHSRVHLELLISLIIISKYFFFEQVEQLHRIFKLCGTPTEDYWKRSKVPTTFRPPRSYKPNLVESFRDFPSCLGLLQILLSIDPACRACAGSALQNEVSN